MQCTAHPFVVPKAILVGIICVLFCSLVSGVELVTVPSTLTAGKTYSITYSPADDTVRGYGPGHSNYIPLTDAKAYHLDLAKG